MFSRWLSKRAAGSQAKAVGWGPPHPPPQPLIKAPPEPEAGWTPTSRPVARTVALISGAALVAAALVSIAALATVLPSNGRTQAPPSTPLRKTARPPLTRPTGSIRSTLSAVNAIIDQTGAGRQKVVAGIDGVQACSMNPIDGQEAIGEVVAERRLDLAQLQRLDDSPSTTHADRYVIQSLITVIDDSVQADQDYSAWMADVGSGPPSCRANPVDDANFAAGQIFSAKTDTDKLAFVQAWNPLAGAAGLSTYSPQDF